VIKRRTMPRAKKMPMMKRKMKRKKVLAKMKKYLTCLLHGHLSSL